MRQLLFTPEELEQMRREDTADNVKSMAEGHDIQRELRKLCKSERYICDDYTREWDKAHGIPQYIINDNHMISKQRLEKAEAKYDS